MKKNIPVYDIKYFSAYKNDGILVSRFGTYAQQHQHLHASHRHNFYHLVFFTKGEGKHQIDFDTFDVRPNLIYFMVPGQVHSWNFVGEPDGYIINFSASYFSSLLLNQDYLMKFSFFKGVTKQQVLDLNETVGNKVTAIFDNILKEGENNTLWNDDLVKVLLLQLFIEIERTVNTAQHLPKNNFNDTILKNFQQLIEQNYTRLKLPKQYAELLYITPNHLNALCNEFLGMSAGRLIRNRIILEAKRLLVNLDIRVAEVAYKLNFEDQSYFVKFFKKYEGLTPDKFRKQYISDPYGTK